MKSHFLTKLHQRLANDLTIPDWMDFILDKSVIIEKFIPPVDRLMDENGLKFWTTREYKPAGEQWNPEEIHQGLDRTYRIILQQDYHIPATFVNQIQLIPEVESVQRLAIGEAELPQPQLSTQASLISARASELIYLPYAHAFTKGLPEITIAVLDTGVNLSHPELRGKVADGADFVDLEGLNTSDFIGDFRGYDDVPEDEVGHGTHVSGIVAAQGLNMEQGVAPDCRILAVRVLATMKNGERLVGAGIVDNINAGIKWAVDKGADIINMSLGIKHTGGGLPHEDVIRYAISKNVTVVAASGNDGTPERYYPGALPGVIAVGAVNERGQVADFTSYGANIYVVAPGMQIYSSFTNHSYAHASGTSQASPFVAGSVGLFKSYARQYGVNLAEHEIKNILKNTSDKVDSRLRNAHAGYGLINLADAFKLLTHMLN